MISRQQSERQAVVTIPAVRRFELDALAESLHCEVEEVPISFEETYTLVVHGQSGEEEDA
jgi:hypothetical protein